MMTGSLRTVAVACTAVLAASVFPGCASRPRTPRDEAFRTALDQGLGVRGRALVVDMGQASPVRLVADGIRLDGDFLFVVEQNHRIDAIGRDDLRMEWSYDAFRAPLKFPPALTAISCLGMIEGQLHEIDLEYGHGKGAVHFDMGPSAPFVATAGTAFIPTWGGSRGEKTLRTINLATGLEGWGWRTTGDIRGAMAIAGAPPRQILYFGTDGGDVVAVPAAEAAAPAPESALWVRSTHGPVTAGLCVSGEDLFVASEDGFLYGLDRITGAIRWASPHEMPLKAGPIATAGAVYQARSDGGLWCHDRATGRVRWKVGGGAKFVVERDGKSILATKDALQAVDASGKVTGLAKVRGWVFPANVKDDSLYAVSADGYIIKLETGGE